MYNSKYYDGHSLKQLRPKEKAIHTYKISNGIIVGMFKGNRGNYPDLDFKIKILRQGEQQYPEPPIHTYWVVDLIIKAQQHPIEVNGMLNYYIDFYQYCQPFNNIKERANYQIQTVDFISKQYKNLDVPNTLPIDYIALIIELFCLCEKRNDGAYMFLNLLHTLKDYVNGNADYMNVIKSSMPIKRYSALSK